MGNTSVLWQHNTQPSAKLWMHHPKVGPPGAKRKVCIVGSTPSTSRSTQTVHHAESPTPSSHSSPEKTAHCAEPPLPASNINLSSDYGPLSPSYLSDTPSQLLEEVQKYTPAELLKEAQALALRLLKSIPEACPGDLLHIWDANSVSAIVLSLPDGGVDPSEDVEYVDHMLNHVFQGTGVSRLIQEMQHGSCGPLGIVEGLNFFAEHCNLNLVQFEVKLLKLVKALRRCVYPNHEKAPLFHECSPSLKHRSTASPTSHPHSSPVRHPHPLPSKAAHRQAKTVHFSDDDGSGNDGDSSELDDDENTDEDVHQDNTAMSPGAKTQGKSYVTGPLPIELANEVKGLTQAFTDALAKLAEKHNRPLHQVEHLANLTSTLKAKCASNPFNGYAQKWKKEGLPALPSSELKDAYLKEKEAFDGDPKGLESWLEDLCILAQTARVDNDIKLTQGSKVAKFMA
ncbi:hypothetical protein BS47DRAFT_1400155 [Hydnum rufescens UP504]|uniref:Uncharacterized protein n=1 Tax=Hydnum rufescens UP504 TaxID=1448309 RepID=A0A9P6AIY9_9AGAM|nr:hypothetical protein BS47DRAFT_1400155 [Hydnum rufescens UP504]